MAIGGWACGYQADMNIIARTLQHWQPSVDNGAVKPARPSLVQAEMPWRKNFLGHGPKGRTGGTSGLHRTA